MKDSLHTIAALAITYCYCCHQITSTHAQQQQQQSIDDVLTALGEETIRFRDEVKRYLTTTSTRTTSSSIEPSCDWLTSCINKNYDHCYSKFPNEVCPFNSTSSSSTSNSSSKSVCSPCGAKSDTTISAVRIADDSQNLDDITKFNIFHDICTTRILDDTYFKDKSTIKDGHRAMYFGSVDGMFRIYPASFAQSKSPTEQATCKPYDPRMRPWYTAATSIERNVILLLDMSLSHIDDAFGNRLQNMKDATIRIITSTTIADKISVILFNETSISVINDRLFYGTIQNKNFLIETVTNLTVSFDTSTGTNTVANRTAVYEKALEVSNDSRCGGTAILLFTNDIKNTKDAIKIMDPTVVQYETTTGKSILSFIFLTELSDITSHTFDCTGTSFRCGIYSTITTTDEIGKGLSVYFTVFQKAYELQQTVKISSAVSTTNVAWVEVYEFYELGQLGTTASASIYDDTTGQLLGVVGIDNTIDAIQQLTNTTTIDTIKEKIEYLAGNKDNTNICFNFTLLIPCNFHFYQNNNISNTVLCTANATQTSNFTCPSANSSLITNETGLVPSVFNNITRRTSTINNNAKACCTSYLIANACNVIDETSILWNNINDYGKTYTERACCTFTNSSNSDDSEDDTSGVCSATSIATVPTVSSTFMPVSTPSTTIPRDKTTITTTSTTTSATSKATSGGAIFGYAVSGVAVFCVLIFFYMNRQNSLKKQSNQNHIQFSIPDPPKRTRPPPVPPMYDD